MYRKTHTVDKEKAKAYQTVWYQSNKDKEKAKNLKWKIANPIKVQAMQAKYRKNNKEKCSLASALCRKARPEQSRAAVAKRKAIKLSAPGNGITTKQWKAIVESANGICTYCKQYFEKLTLDHVVPLTKGGAHDISNAVAACSSCNSSKGSKLLSEWLR